VVVARTRDGLGAYGFLLEQDLSEVGTEEFAVPERFRRSMVPIEQIGRLAGLSFDAALIAGDQFDDRGVEVARRAGVRRRRA
jgi:endonuclease G